MSDMYELPTTAIGNILSIIAVALTLGTLLLGYLSDKVFMSREKVLFYFFKCSLVTALEVVGICIGHLSC